MTKSAGIDEKGRRIAAPSNGKLSGDLPQKPDDETPTLSRRTRAVNDIQDRASIWTISAFAGLFGIRLIQLVDSMLLFGIHQTFF